MALPTLTLGHEAKPFEYDMLCNYEMGAMGQSRRWQNCVLSFLWGRQGSSAVVAEQVFSGVLAISGQVRSRICQLFTVFVIVAEST